MLIIIISNKIKIPSLVENQRTERQRDGGQKAADNVRVANGADVAQSVGGQPIGGRAARDQGLSVYAGQPRLKLAETGAERHHGAPLVQAGPEHGQQVDGTGHHGKIARDQQLHGHGHGHHEHDGEEGHAVRGVQGRGRPRLSVGPKQAQPPAHSKRRVHVRLHRFFATHLLLRRSRVRMKKKLTRRVGALNQVGMSVEIKKKISNSEDCQRML